MATVFYLLIEEDDTFLKIASSTSNEEMEGLPHFLNVLDEMLKDEKCMEALETDWGEVEWGDFVHHMDEAAIQRFLGQHGIRLERIWLYPLYKVREDEKIGESYPRPECP